MWSIRLFAAVLLLPLVALAARTADGIARVAVARLHGAPLPPVRDAAGLASPDTIGPMGSDAPSYRAASPLSISLLSISSLSISSLSGGLNTIYGTKGTYFSDEKACTTSSSLLVPARGRST